MCGGTAFDVLTFDTCYMFFAEGDGSGPFRFELVALKSIRKRISTRFPAATCQHYTRCGWSCRCRRDNCGRHNEVPFVWRRYSVPAGGRFWR